MQLAEVAVRPRLTVLNAFSFRMLSYNVLAEIYSDTCESRDFRYSYCPPFALTYDYRKQLLLDEIIGWYKIHPHWVTL